MIFEATIGQIDHLGDIALDDISLTTYSARSCPGRLRFILSEALM